MSNTPRVTGQRPQPTTGKTVIKKPKKPAKPHGIPTEGERLAIWLANPGLRSKLPDSALTEGQLAQRKTNAFNAAPAAPGSSYTNGSLNQLLDILTRQKFGPEQQALDQRGHDMPLWFQAYRKQVDDARLAENAAVGQQVTSLNNFATQASGDLGYTGDGSDPAAAQRAQAAAAVRASGITNQAAIAQQLGGIQNSFLTNTGLNSFGLQNGAMAQLGQQRQQLARDRGDFRVTQRGQILSDEADSALKNALTASQIGENEAQTSATQATTAKTKADTTKTKAENAYFKKYGHYPKRGGTSAADKVAEARLKFFNEHGYFPPTGPPKTGKGGDKDEFGNTPKQRQAAQDSFDKARRLAKQYKPSVKTESELVDFLVGAKNVNIAMARAAAQAAFHEGRVGPKTKGRLKRRGVTKFPKGTPTVSKDTADTVNSAISGVGALLSNLPGS
jgi:hypothetical protein